MGTNQSGRSQTRKWMARPLREVIRNVAMAVAEGQADLDRNAVAIQRELERAIEDGEVEDVLELPHYQFAEVDVDLEATLAIGAKPERPPDGREDDRPVFQPTLIANLNQPPKKTEVESRMTSKVKFKIVPTPPPKGDGGAGRRRGRPTTDGESPSNGGDGR